MKKPWDIGSLSEDWTRPCCLPSRGPLPNSSKACVGDCDDIGISTPWPNRSKPSTDRWKGAQFSVFQIPNVSGFIKSSRGWSNGQFNDDSPTSSQSTKDSNVRSGSAGPWWFLCELKSLGLVDDEAELNRWGSVVRGASHGCIVWTGLFQARGRRYRRKRWYWGVLRTLRDGWRKKGEKRLDLTA